MGKINTAANLSSAASNRAAARSAAQTSASVGKLASSDRHRELRARGLITHRSTPNDIAVVEAELAAQMRGRMVLQGSPYWNRYPYKGPIVAGGVFLVIALSVLGGDKPWMALIFIIPIVVVGAFWVPSIRRQEQERADTIASADWNDDGTCAWCGSDEPHIVEGEEEHPRVAHAYELEQELGPLWVLAPTG